MEIGWHEVHHTGGGKREDTHAEQRRTARNLAIRILKTWVREPPQQPEAVSVGGLDTQ